MWREILGLEKKPNNLLELIVPRRTFADVVLPEETRRQLYEALTQIEKHRLVFHQWGLGERHPTGLGLAFNFAGPPGTGKSICAEAVAYALGRKLLRVRYSELESCWAGETGKNIHAVFREARAQDAVLFFDEADSIAARRFSNVQIGYERESNQAVNILLKDLEEHDGVVIFATNMASNFDPAFERRIRNHILFRIPSVGERERIWKVQIHPDRTPLGADVDFRDLAERFEVSGGDIRNAVLKAALIAAAEEGPDETKHILQRHFVQAMEQVLAAKVVLQQNALDPDGASFPWAAGMLEARLETLDEGLDACRTELGLLHEEQTALAARAAGADDGLQRLGDRVEALGEETRSLGGALEGLRAELEQAREAQSGAITAWKGEREGLDTRLAGFEERLKGVTLLPLSRAATLAVVSLYGLLLLVLAAAAWLHH